MFVDLPPMDYNNMAIVESYHEQGYTGQNDVKIGLLDTYIELPQDDKRFDNVELVGEYAKENGKRINTKYTYHSKYSILSIRQILPDAKIYLSYPDKQGMKYFKEHNIDVVIAPLSYSKERLGKYDNPEYVEDMYLFTSAGNEGEKGSTYPAIKDNWISIGSVRVDEGLERIKTSAVDNTLDFMGEANYWVYPNKYIGNMYSGTSAAVVRFGALVGLMDSKAKYNLPPPLLYKVLQNNSIDMYDEGHDQKSGYGYFLLPNLEDIWW